MKVTVDYNNSQYFFEEKTMNSNYKNLKTNYDIFGISRPTENKTKGLPKNTTESEYLKNNIDWVAGLPMTIPINGVDSSYFDNNLVDFILGLQPQMDINEQLKQMQGLFKNGVAFTDFQQPSFKIKQGKIINEINSKIKPLICGGLNNFVKVIGDKKNYKGTLCWPIDVIDTSKNYKKFNPIDNPELFFKPSNSVRKPLFNSKGKFTLEYQENIVEQFHWFNNKVILPIQGKGEEQGSQPGTCIGWIDEKWIE